MKKNFLFLLLLLLSIIIPAGRVSATETNPNDKHYIYNIDNEEIGYFTGDPSNAALSISRFDIKCTPYSKTAKTICSISGIDIHTRKKANTELAVSGDNAEYLFVYLEGNTLDIRYWGKSDYISGVLNITLSDELTFSLPYTANKVDFKEIKRYYPPKTTVKTKMVGYVEKVRYTSSNKKVATVNKKGVVKTKKEGHSVITAITPCGKTSVVVNVTKDKKMYKLLKKTEKILYTWSYDQSRRGQKGYYDCSSLVWRVYNQYYSIKFGTSSYGTTFSEYPWCKNNCKEIKYKKNKYDYLPGDIKFDFDENGNTFHVETFSNYVFCGYNKKGKPILSPWWYFEGDQVYSSKVYRPTARK